MAHLIEGEYYCETIDKMVKESIEIVVEESEGIKNRDRNAVKHLMEALVLSRRGDELYRQFPPGVRQ